MNKVQELYDLACKFLELPDMTRFIIGTHFRVIDAAEFWLDLDKSNKIIFCNSVKKDYESFKSHIEHRTGLTRVH